MSSRVVKILVCDRCRAEVTAPTVAGVTPDGWARLLYRSEIAHLCPDCLKRALSVTP